MTIEELKQALEAATPRPWGWYNDQAADDGGIEASDWWSLGPGVLIADGTDGTPGGDGIDRANARLIVEAVNNLPKLLKVAEAAKDLPYLYDEASANPYDVGYSQVSDEIELLRKALEELNND